jgi:hypothetical protein
MQRNHIHLFEGETSMTAEDEEFNRMEREADMRRKAVSAALSDHVMHMRANLSEYERGVIDGRQMQVQSSVDKAVNALSQRKWVELMRGVRVEGDTVVITVKGGNDEARCLCGELINEMEMRA